VSPETRTYDVTQSKTIRIRGKEDEVDYRFMPEPDLLPLVVTDAMLEGAKDRIPVLPRDSAVDLVKSHGGSGLGFHEAWLLVLDAGAEAFFRDATALLEERLHTQLLNWMFTEVFGVMRSKDVPITEVAGLRPDRGWRRREGAATGAAVPKHIHAVRLLRDALAHCPNARERQALVVVGTINRPHALLSERCVLVTCTIELRRNCVGDCDHL